MTFNGWLQIAIYCVLIFLFVKPFGAYMANVFEGRRTPLSLVLRPIERGIYTVCGVNERDEQHWTAYAISVLLFSIAGFVVLYALQRLQAMLPFNPAEMSAVEQSSSFNTAVSFVTNTNWQGYGGELTMSYLTQMAGLTTQNFVSAAAGIAVAIALVRGFARRSGQTIGNFWVDLTRCVLYVLLPLAIVVALVLIVCGVPQTSPPTPRPRRWKAPSRSSRRGRSRRRSPSSNSAPTAAASSTPTRRIRWRTRTR